MDKMELVGLEIGAVVVWHTRLLIRDAFYLQKCRDEDANDIQIEARCMLNITWI